MFAFTCSFMIHMRIQIAIAFWCRVYASWFAQAPFKGLVMLCESDNMFHDIRVPMFTPPQLRSVYLMCMALGVWEHHERGAWCLGCGESAEGLSCWPPQQASYCWRSRMLVRPHSLLRPSQSTSRLLCAIGKILFVCQDLCRRFFCSDLQDVY